MREMRLAKREITDPEVLKEIVEECDTVRLGLTDAEGMFIVPVNYGYEFTEENGKAELQLYFHGAAEGRKADALKSQSPVAVEMDCRHGIITGDYTCAYSYSYRSIMGNGTVTLLETFEEKLGFYSCTVPTFEQFVLTELINSGDFERHINRVRRSKRKNMQNNKQII